MSEPFIINSPAHTINVPYWDTFENALHLLRPSLPIGPDWALDFYEVGFHLLFESYISSRIPGKPDELSLSLWKRCADGKNLFLSIRLPLEPPRQYTPEDFALIVKSKALEHFNQHESSPIADGYDIEKHALDLREVV